MGSGIYLEIHQDRTGPKLYIGNGGSGFRLMGTKFHGQEQLLRRHELDDRDIDEIRDYLRQAKRRLRRIEKERNAALVQEAVTDAERKSLGERVRVLEGRIVSDWKLWSAFVLEHCPDLIKTMPAAPTTPPEEPEPPTADEERGGRRMDVTAFRNGPCEWCKGTTDHRIDCPNDPTPEESEPAAEQEWGTQDVDDTDPHRVAAASPDTTPEKCPLCGKEDPSCQCPGTPENVAKVAALRASPDTDAQERDPALDPAEGDVLPSWDNSSEILVDSVADGEVAYRVTDCSGGLIGAYRVSMGQWRRRAPMSLAPAADTAQGGESDG